MRTIEIPTRSDQEAATVAVESACRDLVMSSKGTLRTIPGSIHWHFRKPKLTGTLEITYAPSEGIVRIQIHENRKAIWIDEVLPIILNRIESALTR